MNVPVGNVTVKRELIIPLNTNAVILFSHGSGSNRLGKRNQAVAHYLHNKNFGTLLFDLLTEKEDAIYHNRFHSRSGTPAEGKGRC